MRDYTLANQPLGGGVLFMTLFATLRNGGIGISAYCHRCFISLLHLFCLSLVALLLGSFVFPKLLPLIWIFLVDKVRSSFGVLYGQQKASEAGAPEGLLYLSHEGR